MKYCRIYIHLFIKTQNMEDLASLEHSEEPEDNYNHLSDNLIYTSVSIPSSGCCQSDFDCQVVGCLCDNDCSVPYCSCVSRFGPNYCEGGLLLSGKFENSSVTECNVLCKCNSSCSNRVVQKGPRGFLEVFDCGDVRGLGLKTLQTIPKGGFICEYAGEVIGKTEAKRRFEVASLKGDMNYIFVLRENTATDVKETIVDPTVIGNIGRYINHSCCPNSAVIPARVDCVVPKLAIFAVRDIFAGEEITFDYSGGNTGRYLDSDNRKECFCGSGSCLKFLPFDESLY